MSKILPVIPGAVFHRLTTVKPLDGPGRRCWECVCVCGATVRVFENSLKTGNTKSCGCLNRDRQKETVLAFPKKAHWKEYRAWQAMKERCLCPNHIGYKNYGERGITVCQEWQESFDQFYRDMGPCPPKHTLDRIDTNGNYCPANCRWADRKTQARNTRKNVWLVIDGASKILTDWAKDLGVPACTVRRRLRLGQTTALEITSPLPKELRRELRSKNSRSPKFLRLETVSGEDPLATLAGKEMNILEWSKATGINKVTLQARLRTMTLREALTKPVGWSRRPKLR